MKWSTAVHGLLAVAMGAAMGSAADSLPAVGGVSVPKLSASLSITPRRSIADYRLIAERNMFTRHDRREPSVPATQAATAPSPPPPPPPGRAWVVSGTAILTDDRVAFLENTATGTTMRVREGELTEAGRILRIAYDQIEVETPAGIVWIAIGSTLTGEAPSTASASTPDESPAAAAPGATGGQAAIPAPSPAEAAILERLRARRAQEGAR
jgi:hypothetical protein